MFAIDCLWWACFCFFFDCHIYLHILQAMMLLNQLEYWIYPSYHQHCTADLLSWELVRLWRPFLWVWHHTCSAPLCMSTCMLWISVKITSTHYCSVLLLASYCTWSLTPSSGIPQDLWMHAQTTNVCHVKWLATPFPKASQKTCWWENSTYQHLKPLLLFVPQATKLHSPGVGQKHWTRGVQHCQVSPSSSLSVISCHTLYCV